MSNMHQGNAAKSMRIKYNRHEFDFKNRNPLFSEAKIYVMYHGENRNNSYIDKSDVDKALHTIYNIPIVGEFIESEEGEEGGNFGSHGGQIVMDDNGMRFIHTTKPFGLVPESANVYWETIKDEKDRDREYLVVDGALIWNRYQNEAETLKSANFGQSMELEVTDGWFDDENGNYHITDFAFSAFCILGIDGRDGGKVEPAFEDSKIITYSNSARNAVADEFEEMKKELSKFYSLDEAGKEEKELVEDKGKKKEDVTSEDQEADDADESTESKVIQTETTGRAGDVVSDKEEAEKEQGASGETQAGTEGESARDIADDNVDLDSGDSGEVNTGENAQDIANAHTDATATDYEAKYAELKEEFDSLSEEVSDLREFKAEVEKEKHEENAIELFEEMGLNEEDVKGLDIYSHTLEELKEKCFAILGRKAIENKENFAHTGTDRKANKVELSQASAEKKDSTYGHLFRKFGNK